MFKPVKCTKCNSIHNVYVDDVIKCYFLKCSCGHIMSNLDECCKNTLISHLSKHGN